MSVRWWYLALALPLVFAIGSKGALVFMLFVAGAMLAVRIGGLLRSLWVYVAALCLYAAVGIKVGIAAQDYHVIGFIGGLRGFMSNPFGHGIGAGGNLSVSVSTLDWSRSQQLGHTDVAVESAIGVLLYQMGVAAVLVIAAIGWIAWLLWSLYRATDNRACAATALSIIVVAFNGIFQEEALFAPLAFGIVMASAGLLLGQSYRPTSGSIVGAPTYTKI
jgi:hypothetical protein